MENQKTPPLDRWYQSDQGSFISFIYSRSMTDFTAFPLCLHLKTYGGKHPNHHHLNVISEWSRILHVVTISLAIENCSMNNWTLITSWAVAGTVSPKVLSYILPKGTHKVSLNIWFCVVHVTGAASDRWLGVEGAVSTCGCAAPWNRSRLAVRGAPHLPHRSTCADKKYCEQLATRFF